MGSGGSGKLGSSSRNNWILVSASIKTFFVVESSWVKYFQQFNSSNHVCSYINVDYKYFIFI